MKEAYDILKQEFTTDQTWRIFFDAVCAAMRDFDLFRNNLRRSKTLRPTIARKAEELAALMREAMNVHGEWPDEFYSVPALLLVTDSRDTPMRRARRRFSGTFKRKYFEKESVWATAPSLVECLYTLAKSVRAYEPKSTGFGREANPKTDYIRELGTILKTKGIAISPRVIKAMAIVTNVALNDEDLDVSSKDVRQALMVGGITRP